MMDARRPPQDTLRDGPDLEDFKGEWAGAAPPVRAGASKTLKWIGELSFLGSSLGKVRVLTLYSDTPSIRTTA
jgi:hypothetical protein